MSGRLGAPGGERKRGRETFPFMDAVRAPAHRVFPAVRSSAVWHIGARIIPPYATIGPRFIQMPITAYVDGSGTLGFKVLAVCAINNSCIEAFDQRWNEILGR